MLQLHNASIPTCFATSSIGSAGGQELPEKLRVIHEAGFDQIELAIQDLAAYASVLRGEPVGASDYDALVDAGRVVKTLTEKFKLQILMLQPFANFEGYKATVSGDKREDALSRAAGWMRIMEAVGTNMMQIGSSDDEDITTSFEELASDLALLADRFAAKGYRIAYENWCWASRAPNWEHVWQIVKLANRPNLGLCLDTFQSAGGEWADPTTSSGLLESLSAEDWEKSWKSSLDKLAKAIPPEKIFVLQISDAYKMDPPIENKKIDGQQPRSRWSHDYRPLPVGHGGYLPVQDFLDAVLRTGFRGTLSMEVFDYKEMKGEVAMGQFTKSAMESLQHLLANAETGI